MTSFRLRASAFVLLLVLSSAGLAACQSPQDKSYLDVVNKHNPTLKAKIDAVTTTCKEANAACTTASKDGKTEADSFLSDLKGQSPPSCVSDADGKLKTGLALFSTSLQGLADASAAGDVTAGNASLDALQKGIDSYNSAVDSANKASC